MCVWIVRFGQKLQGKQMTFSPRKCHKDQFNWRCKTC